MVETDDRREHLEIPRKNVPIWNCVNAVRKVIQWIESHPGRAGTLAGWYQQGASALTALIAVPLIMSHMNARDAGLWFSFQAIVTVIQLTDFGLSFVIARQVAHSLTAAAAGTQSIGGPDFIPTRPGWLGISDVYWASRLMFRWVSLVGLVLLIALYHLVLPQGKLLVEATGETMVAWYLFGVSALAALLAKPHQALLDGLAKLYLTRFISGTTLLLGGFGAVGILLLGGNLAMMAGAVGGDVAARLRVGPVARAVHGWRAIDGSRAAPGGAVQKFHAGGDARWGVLNASAYCVSSVQVPLLGSLLGPAVVPPFYLAQRIGQMLNQVSAQLIFPQMPLFTQALAGGKAREARARMKRIILWVTLLGAGANTIFYFGSPLFVEWWVGPAHYVSKPVLLLMSLDYWILGTTVVWGFFRISFGDQPFSLFDAVGGPVELGFVCCFGSSLRFAGHSPGHLGGGTAH